jgi:hypothetical protein
VRRLDDGTFGVQPVILYGAATFAATGRGRRSAPTTAMRKACVTACGAAWVVDADEHRSTKCCSGCGCVLARVEQPTPWRVYAAADARAEAPLPLGWARPPPTSAPRRPAPSPTTTPTPRPAPATGAARTSTYSAGDATNAAADKSPSRPSKRFVTLPLCLKFAPC